MKLSVQLASLALLAVSVLAHTADDAKLEDQDLSLPDLEQLDNLDAPGWKIGGNSKFEAGRLILTPSQHTKGSVTNDLSVAYDSFTIESVFRSSGSWGKTDSGYSLRYVKEHNLKDTSFFGGPSKFDGLNVVVDSNSPIGSSIHAFLNDGTVDFAKLSKEELYDRSFGSCLVSYQDSQVPSTLRISSYNGVLLVQVNNRVCLKTKQVKVPKDYKVGLSAVTRGKKEQFELLRLKTYGGVLSEVLENDGLLASQPNVVKKFVQVDADGKETVLEDKPKAISNNGEKKLTSDYLNSLETIQKSNQDILSHFSTLESKINGLSSIANSGKEVDFSFLEEYSKQLKSLGEHVLKIQDGLKSLDQRFDVLETNFRTEINTLVSTVNKLNSDNINQLRDNEHSIDELGRNIQYLVLSEKDRQQNPVHELVGGLKYLIIPILVVTAILSFFTYRLRREIKSKLL